MNAYIIGIDYLVNALKLYCLSDEKHDTLDTVNKADGTKYCDRIGSQCFDVYVSDKTFAKYKPLGLTVEKLKSFYETRQLLPFKPASYNGKYFMSFDDFGLAAVLMQSNAKGGE